MRARHPKSTECSNMILVGLVIPFRDLKILELRKHVVVLATMVYQKSYWIASQGPEINVPEAEFYWKQRILAMGFAWFCLLAEYAPLIFSDPAAGRRKQTWIVWLDKHWHIHGIVWVASVFANTGLLFMSFLTLARSCERWDNEPPSQLPSTVVHGEVATRNATPASTAAIGLPASPSAARADGPDSRPRDGAARRCCNGRAGPAGAASDHGHDAGASCVGAACRALALLALNCSSVLWRLSLQWSEVKWSGPFRTCVWAVGLIYDSFDNCSVMWSIIAQSYQ